MTSKENWRPETTLSAMKARAALLGQIRSFMDGREILEVETPYLSHAYNSDPNLINLKTNYHSPDKKTAQTLYLHTSPEFPMKRLLASGSGSIYQIARVFRDREQGHQHNPEFTMLEWYRVGFNYQQLMDEVNEFLMQLGAPEAERKTYQEVFSKNTNLNPHTTTDEELTQYANDKGLVGKISDRSNLLDYIFSHQVADKLGQEKPCLVYDYPVEQAALAKRSERNGVQVSQRFELFIAGKEIANGYNELSDANELRQRFEKEQQQNDGPLDENLLQAMIEFPECAGVALGIDRLLMVLMKMDNIKDVINFPVDKA